MIWAKWQSVWMLLLHKKITIHKCFSIFKQCLLTNRTFSMISHTRTRLSWICSRMRVSYRAVIKTLGLIWRSIWAIICFLVFLNGCCRIWLLLGYWAEGVSLSCMLSILYTWLSPRQQPCFVRLKSGSCYVLKEVMVFFTPHRRAHSDINRKEDSSVTGDWRDKVRRQGVDLNTYLL